MKVLIIQSDGAHKGQDSFTRNDYLRECYAIQHAFTENGVIADIWGLRHHNFEQIPDFNSYDIVFCIENYEFSWLPNFANIKPLKIHWVIDLHCNENSHYYHTSKNFDIILHSTESIIDKLKCILPNKKHIWFPNGVDDRYFYNRNMDKSIDFAFVGSKNESRKEFIERLEKEENLKYFFATGVDMINIISTSKIHFNKNISTDINYRTFETIGLGTCLITNHSNELEKLGFIDNYNCLIYKKYEDIPLKIKCKNIKDISIKGSNLANEHTYVKRIKILLENIK